MEASTGKGTGLVRTRYVGSAEGEARALREQYDSKARAVLRQGEGSTTAQQRGEQGQGKAKAQAKETEERKTYRERVSDVRTSARREHPKARKTTERRAHPKAHGIQRPISKQRQTENRGPLDKEGNQRIGDGNR